jgi:hypothetical protein
MNDLSQISKELVDSYARDRERRLKEFNDFYGKPNEDITVVNDDDDKFFFALYKVDVGVMVVPRSTKGKLLIDQLQVVQEVMIDALFRTRYE